MKICRKMRSLSFGGNMNHQLSLTGDSFPKTIVRNDIGKSWYDEQGVLNIGLTGFLLNRSIAD